MDGRTIAVTTEVIILGNKIMRVPCMKPTLFSEHLASIDRLLEQGFMEINHGTRLDAMEAIYTASCLLEEIRSELQTPSGARQHIVTDARPSTALGAHPEPRSDH